MDLNFNRIQFTPDLMPADILGTNMIVENEQGNRSFEFQRGPVFTQILLADEINRATPKTQSAMLETMQEGTVTAAGTRFTLDKPFFVLATQNPIEQEGTYPLPEAQLDRFLMQIDIDYPDLDAERQMLAATTGVNTATTTAVMTHAELQQAQNFVRRMPIGEQVVDAILALVRAARPNEGCLLYTSPSPRDRQKSRMPSSA